MPATLPPMEPLARFPWPGRLFAWWTAAAVLTVLWELSGLDAAVMRWIGTPAGFPLQHAWWLERVLHEGLRQVATWLFAGLWVWALWPAGTRSLPRRERVGIALLVALSLLLVSLIKNTSATSCPWDWRMFGGQAEPVAHWRWGVADGGPGRCFPGGHASSAFGFVALCLPWLAPPARAVRRAAAGHRWLALVAVAGLVAGAVQTLRGAHPPSHTLWTLLVCGAVSLSGWCLLLPWLARKAPAPAFTTPDPVAAAGRPACR